MGEVSDQDLTNASVYSFRHFVSFTYYARSAAIFAANKGLALPCSCSAFVMSVRGVWCLVTAGHVLEDIEKEREAGIEHVSFRLWDGWAVDAPHRQFLPFDLFSLERRHLHKDGMDYGLIFLPRLFASNLAANKVIPISEASYEKDWPADFDAYAMIGTPAAAVKLEHLGGKTTRLTQGLFVIRLERVNDPPDELRKPYERFYGKLAIDEKDPLWQQIGANIEGMSGGPILGISRGDDGLRYWVVGIQSGWLPSKRIIAACDFQAFARFVGGEIDDAVREAIPDTEPSDG